ncbi:MAG TPA: hypothetical protein VJ916_03520 [Anaerovoracaceae bacterium]|nr:hypothetical protein [Anaerovoracaceae bacterium]
MIIFKVGIKYCGGCNPSYDRVKMLNQIKENFSFEFHYAKPRIKYDVLIIINGCTSICADYQNLDYKDKIIIKNEKDYEKAVELLNQINNKK